MKTRRIKSKLAGPRNVDQPLPTPPVDAPNPEALIDFRTIRPVGPPLEPGMSFSAELLRQFREGLYQSVAVPPELLLQGGDRISELLRATPDDSLLAPETRRYPGLASHISTRPVSITSGVRVLGTRRDPLTNEEYSIDQPTGPNYDASRVREWVNRIDYGIMAMAQLRFAFGLEQDRSSTLSVLRFDVLMRILLPSDYSRMCNSPLPEVIQEVARSFGYEELGRTQFLTSSEGEVVFNDRLCDLVVHYVMSRIAAGHWGTF